MATKKPVSKLAALKNRVTKLSPIAKVGIAFSCLALIVVCVGSIVIAYLLLRPTPLVLDASKPEVTVNSLNALVIDALKSFPEGEVDQATMTKWYKDFETKYGMDATKVTQQDGEVNLNLSYYTGKQSLSSYVYFTLSLNIKQERQNNGDVLTYSKGTLSLQMNNLTDNASFEVLASSADEQYVYFRITKMPVSILRSSGILTSSKATQLNSLLANKWIKFDIKKLLALASTYNTSATKSVASITAADKQKLLDAFNASPVFINGKTTVARNIGGTQIDCMLSDMSFKALANLPGGNKNAQLPNTTLEFCGNGNNRPGYLSMRVSDNAATFIITVSESALTKSVSIQVPQNAIDSDSLSLPLVQILNAR